MNITSESSLDFIFNPKRIALIGVTSNPQSVGGKVLQNLIGGGFQGVVYPVNPQFEAVLGIQCYPSLQNLPKSPDLAVICSPPQSVPDYVMQCGDCGVKGVIIISAGFKETGEAGKLLETKIMEIQSHHNGMRILGPNCLGVIVPRAGLNASFSTGMPRDGDIAFISQSGALCSSVLDWALEENIGFSYFVSIGNMLDVDFGDLIDYFGEDEKTKSIILYIESIRDARKFMSASRAFARTKPIIAFKGGRYPESAEAAASHTGAMASEDAIYDAAFKRAGMARVTNIGEIFDCADLIGRKKIPLGPKLGIITNAGGPGVIATDSLIANGGVLANFSEKTLSELDKNLPSAWSHRNPVDILGDARSKRVAKTLEIVLQDQNVDAVLVIITPQAMTNPASIAKVVGQMADTTTKPILAAWLGGQSMREGIRILNASGIATYTTPEQAVGAFMKLVSYSRNLESLYETPKDILLQFPVDRKIIRERFNSVFTLGKNILSETESKDLLQAYGIPVTQPYLSASPEEAVEIAGSVGYPLVLKIESPDITHKSDCGGVILDISNKESLIKGYQTIIDNVKNKLPDAKITGVTLQKMIAVDDGIEMILGTKKDPVFGTVIMVGSGGVTAELFGDSVLGFPPLNERLAYKMIKDLKIWPLLNGYRGKPKLNIERLVEMLIRLSYLVSDYPEIKELDINPLLVTQNDVVALDARVILDRKIIENPIKPYSHLVLRPYPEEFVKKIVLHNHELTLRPIKPEDEPMWFELLGSCSKESLYTRFRSFFDWRSHQVASRYCFIDYEREIAIVAEIEEKGKRKLLGVGRLIVEPDQKSVEYAILVCDAWQNKGLGSTLTKYCVDIAKQWGMQRIIAHTNVDNPRMIAVFKKLDFEIIPAPEGFSVDVIKELI